MFAISRLCQSTLGVNPTIALRDMPASIKFTGFQISSRFDATPNDKMHGFRHTDDQQDALHKYFYITAH